MKEEMSDGLDLSALLGIPQIDTGNNKSESVEQDQEPELDFGKLKIVDSIADLEADKVIEDDTDTKEPVKEIKTPEQLKQSIAKDDDDDEDTEETPEVTSTEDNPLKIWGQWAGEQGIIEFNEEEFEAAEDKEAYIVQKQDEKFKAEVERYKETVNPLIKELMDYDDEDLDIAKILEHQKTIQSFEKITTEQLEEDVDLQREVVRRGLEMTGQYSKEEIDSEIEDFEDSGILLKKAERGLPKIVQLEKKAKDDYIQGERERQKKEVERFNQYVKDNEEYIGKLDNILPGVKLSPKEKRQVLDNFTKVDREGKTTLQRAIEKNPKRFYALVTYLATVKDWDFSDIQTSANTKAARKVKETVNTYQEDTKSKLAIDPKVLKDWAKRQKRNGF